MSDFDFSAMRAHMIASQLRTNSVGDPRLLDAFGSVAREAFAAAGRAGQAYADAPLPSADGALLNPPLVTARLFVEADLAPGEKLLVVGSVPAYAAAIAERLGCHVSTDTDDGPFDAILIDGAVEHLPGSLVAALRDGGRIVCGLSEDGVTRLAAGVKRGGQVALRPFADHDVVPVPGFERPKVFSF